MYGKTPQILSQVDDRHVKVTMTNYRLKAKKQVVTYE